MSIDLPRCPWAGTDPQMIAYHDEEWGVPCHDDQDLFERLSLEGFQAGLSWRTILHKRAAFRKAFAGFDPARVAAFDPADIERFLADPGIVRNRAKITATIRNAAAVLAIQREQGSFDRYLWSFVGDSPPTRAIPPAADDRPNHTPVSDALSRDLKQRGFTFVGTTICYAFMQSVGMVNDHVAGCFRAGPDSHVSTR
jgi:DNA-3-methyladenine glycosylase I